MTQMRICSNSLFCFYQVLLSGRTSIVRVNHTYISYHIIFNISLYYFSFRVAVWVFVAALTRQIHDE